MNFGELSNPQLKTLIFCPITGVLVHSNAPMILTSFSNSTIQNNLPSFDEYSMSTPGSSTVRQTVFPKHRVQDSPGGQTTFWHFGHSGMTNLPLFNSASKILMIPIPEQLRMLRQRTCFVLDRSLGFLFVFFLTFPVTAL